MKWFRLHSAMLHDPKVQRLPAELFKHWVNLLCLANEQPERGTLPELSKVAYELHIEDDEAREVIAQLAKRGLMDKVDEGDDAVPHNWNKWQPDRDVAPNRRPSKPSQEQQRDKNHGDVTDSVTNVTQVSRSPSVISSLDLTLDSTSEPKVQEERAPRPKPEPFNPTITNDERDLIHEKFIDCWSHEDIDLKIVHLLDWCKRAPPSKRWSPPYSTGIINSMLRDATPLRERRERMNGNARPGTTNVLPQRQATPATATIRRAKDAAPT